jgi:hypothetical protein
MKTLENENEKLKSKISNLSEDFTENTEKEN